MLALNPYSEIAFFRKKPSIFIIVTKLFEHLRRALKGLADPLQLTSLPLASCVSPQAHSYLIDPYQLSLSIWAACKGLFLSFSLTSSLLVNISIKELILFNPPSLST